MVLFTDLLHRRVCFYGFGKEGELAQANTNAFTFLLPQVYGLGTRNDTTVVHEYANVIIACKVLYQNQMFCYTFTL